MGVELGLQIFCLGGMGGAYIEQATDDGEDDDCGDGNDDAVLVTSISAGAVCDGIGVRYQLQALRAETTGFMVMMLVGVAEGGGGDAQRRRFLVGP